MKADGSLSRLYRGESRGFEGAVVGLGALGIVVDVMLDTVPMFEVAQTVYEKLPWKELEGELDAILSGAYSVSLFTHWTSDLIDQVWVKRAEGENTPDYFGANAADGPRHPLPDMPAENCTEQGGIPGPVPDRLPHFRMAFTPSGGEELQTEYILPRERAFEAMTAIDGMRERIAPLLFVTEIRTAAADRLWLSPFYERDSVCLHFTWKPLQPQVEALLPEIEARLVPLGARPHWGKLFATSVEGMYPVWRSSALSPTNSIRAGSSATPFSNGAVCSARGVKAYTFDLTCESSTPCSRGMHACPRRRSRSDRTRLCIVQ